MIETIHLTKHFGSIKAVDDLSFKVETGEVLGFLGPNGAGKSTTMKMLTGFLAPTSGTAKICGHDILENPMEAKTQLGYLPETAASYGEMTPVAFLNFIASVRGLTGSAAKDAIERSIERCMLQGVRHQTIETLSKGYRRRVGLAQAILHDPHVLIMDEPTDGLDPNQKFEVRGLISRMAKDKVIILSTHILEEVEAVCTRAVIIAHGKLLADGTPDQLRQKSRRHGAVTISIKSAPDGIQDALGRAPHVDKVESLKSGEDGVVRFTIFPTRGKSIAAGVTELAREKKWDLHELHVEQGHLDEVFRDLTRPAKNEEKKS